MAYLVVVSFDLKNADSDDYGCVYSELSKFGLKNRIVGGNGKDNKLPTTTVAGELDGTSASQLRDQICDKVAAAYRVCNLKGDAFISVGGDWSWGIRHP